MADLSHLFLQFHNCSFVSTSCSSSRSPCSGLQDQNGRQWKHPDQADRKGKCLRQEWRWRKCSGKWNTEGAYYPKLHVLSQLFLNWYFSSEFIPTITFFITTCSYIDMLGSGRGPWARQASEVIWYEEVSTKRGQVNMKINWCMNINHSFNWMLILWVKKSVPH